MKCCTAPEDASTHQRPLVEWSAREVERWLRAQPELRTANVNCSKLLKGITGHELADMVEDDLDELGVPRSMRRFLMDHLIDPTVDVQLRRELPQTSLPPSEVEGSVAGFRRNSGAPGNIGEKVVAVMAGALAATTGFLASEKEKKSQGKETAADTMATSVSLPYEWASQSAEFGMEFVRNALEVGTTLPMIGACFTLCLIIAKSAEQVYANNHNCTAMASLAKRVSHMLASSDMELLEAAANSVGELQHALKDAVEAVQAYSKKGWLRKLATPGGDTARFKDVHDRILAEMQMLQFDVQMHPPQWRDESKALRAKVLERTGRTVEQGGLEDLLKVPGARDDLRSALGCEARVLSAELEDISRKVDRISTNVDATLNIEVNKELRNAVQLNVQLTQPSKKTAHGQVYLQEADVREGMFTRKVAAFRVMTGHPVEMQLSVMTKDAAELRVRAIERVEQVETSYSPAEASRRRWCCSGTTGGVGDYFTFATGASTALLFTDDDVDIPLDNPCRACVLASLPEDGGPKGEVLKLVLRMWVSFEPSPTFGEGFERGKTVSVKQTLYFSVYKKGSSRFMLRDMEDHATKQRRGVAAIAAPVLAIPLMVHKRQMARTESLLKQQMVGWNDGSRYQLGPGTQ